MDRQTAFCANAANGNPDRIFCVVGIDYHEPLQSLERSFHSMEMMECNFRV